MAQTMRTFLIIALSVQPVPLFAQKSGEVRQSLLRTVERSTKNVLKRIGKKSYSCVGKTVIGLYARETYQCNATRKFPFCDIPGPNRKYCPDVCSDGRWVVTGTREQIIRELVTDCNPIEDPFGSPTKRAGG